MGAKGVGLRRKFSLEKTLLVTIKESATPVFSKKMHQVMDRERDGRTWGKDEEKIIHIWAM